MQKSVMALGFLTALLPSHAVVASDDISLSGFGALVGGTVVDGDGYWARLPEAAGQYDSGVDFQTESRLGIQARYRATKELSMTGQMMVRGIDDYEPELEWLYASYSMTPDLTANVGRMRLPVYHYSDYMDVGIAYPWLRVPSDVYSLAVTNYHGASIQYNFDWDMGTTAFKIYAGQQHTDPNKLITTIEQYKTEQLYDEKGRFIGVRDVRTTKDYEDMKGVVVDTSIDWFNLRLSYLQGKENFTFYGEGDYPSTPLFSGGWTDTQFIDLSVSVDYENLFFIAEWNDYDAIYQSWFTSAAYRIGKWTPYLFYSTFEGELTSIGDPDKLDDQYSSVGLGLGYNISSRLALKAEVTDFSDKGDAPVFIDENRDGDTDATAFAVSVDFSF